MTETSFDGKGRASTHKIGSLGMCSSPTLDMQLFRCAIVGCVAPT